MTTDELSVAEILDAAGIYLDDHEWIQGDYYVGEDGKPVRGSQRHHKVHGCCAKGAILQVVKEDEWAYQAACDLTEARLGGQDLDDWQDEPGRTKQEVVDLLCDADHDYLLERDL